ncbi:TPA: hypothetical protein JD369_000302 [Citrobacter freundii]|nr:hypothetical protein [Citrobacter freundii]
MKLKNLPVVLLVGSLLLTTGGCSVYSATQQPEKKDISLFRHGTPRSVLLAEFGYPTAQTEHDGKKWDLWRFKQGYSGGVKASRAVGHAAMDVLTLWIWEVAGTPIESAADGTDMAYEVSYDQNHNVDQVITLKK